MTDNVSSKTTYLTEMRKVPVEGTTIKDARIGEWGNGCSGHDTPEEALTCLRKQQEMDKPDYKPKNAIEAALAFQMHEVLEHMREAHGLRPDYRIIKRTTTDEVFVNGGIQ